ncbi:nitroreductase family protein [Alteribacillus sp. JSM 102045]|uniref:nitroreductase family protein n=1 Tax=Alteribacillus sp. JSM 102045 TaxID=1562101 RepID=UPI0035C1C119
MKKIFKKFFSNKRLTFIKTNLNFMLIKIMAKSKFLSSVYYLFSGGFKREHYSVLNGKLKHLQDIKNKDSNQYLLRRNIHRLEKGLLMRPTRKVFAVGYLEETVNCYKALIDSQKGSDFVNLGELKWASDVLTNFFEVAGSHEVIDKMEKVFSEIKHIDMEEDLINTKYVPYVRNLKAKPNVSYENLLELAKFRRSVRWFEPKSVPKNIVDKAIKLASLSPSACNRQPFKFKIFDDPNLLSKLSELPMGTKGYSDNIPTMVALVGDLSAYPFERDRHLIYIDSSLAAMSFILALETQGISSCIINWPDIESLEESIVDFLSLKDCERVIMLIGIGYPDETGKVAYSKKKNLHELRQYNI